VQIAGILLIDDEPIDIEAMRRILEPQGFTVWSGGNHDDAQQLFQEHSEAIDLLLVDVSLPGRSGVEIASDLLRRKPDLRVLFVSGYVGAEVIRFHGLPATDIHFLRKPFRADELVKRVSDVLKSNEPMRWIDPRREDERAEESRKPTDGT
jgi:DNA-binding response OmpR family regulator